MTERKFAEYEVRDALMEAYSQETADEIIHRMQARQLTTAQKAEAAHACELLGETQDLVFATLGKTSAFASESIVAKLRALQRWTFVCKAYFEQISDLKGGE